MNSAPESPVKLLEDLAALTMGDKAIETRSETVRNWRAFTLHVGDMNLAFPFMGGFEILPSREIQPVPWAQDWVRGITNVRGEIYTVVDFALYLEMPAVRSLRTATLFMLPDTSLKSALLIDSKVNLKTFSEHMEHVDMVNTPEHLRSSVSATLKDGEDIWTVVDVHSLCRADVFTNIGIA
jgi:twitching motility protein PilI